MSQTRDIFSIQGSSKKCVYSTYFKFSYRKSLSLPILQYVLKEIVSISILNIFYYLSI